MNLYELLQVQASADEVEIKKAYHAQARIHHPDKGGDPEKFKKIHEAYQILSDPEQRRTYDRTGTTVPKSGFPGFSGYSSGFPGFSSGYSSGFPFFDAWANMKNTYRSLQRGADIKHILKISLEHLYKGTTKTLKLNKNVICTFCKGGRFRAGNSCTQCKGKGLIRGQELFKVQIKPGMQDGREIRFPGAADEGINMEPGDLVITLRVLPHPDFKVKGSDLHYTQKISLLQSLIGFEATIRQLDGRVLCFKSPANRIFKTGDTSKVKGEGLKTEGGDAGTLVITFLVEIDQSLRFSPQDKLDLERILGGKKPPPAPTRSRKRKNGDGVGAAQNVKSLPRTSKVREDADPPPPVPPFTVPAPPSAVPPAPSPPPSPLFPSETRSSEDTNAPEEKNTFFKSSSEEQEARAASMMADMFESLHPEPPPPPPYQAEDDVLEVICLDSSDEESSEPGTEHAECIDLSSDSADGS